MMKWMIGRTKATWWSLALGSVLVLGVFHANPCARADDEVDFVHDVVPILRQHCGNCHLGNQREGGLSLTNRADILSGGDSGPAVTWTDGETSELLRRVQTDEDGVRMPPDGEPLTPAQVAVLEKWVAARLPWDEQFQFVRPTYEPPLLPRRPELPAATSDRDNPVDRILDAYFASTGLETPGPSSDAAFLRRLHLDLIGLLPTPDELTSFLEDADPHKRSRVIEELLERDVDYTEHWLTFWNDLLRNDYTGTGFITGGRKQITGWLYASLAANKPYDAMVRELIAPSSESEGFNLGIRWRGDVNSSQTQEVQFAQNVSQAFLGINMKCASCHDSFVDHWKLEQAYGLAAIIATEPLELHRCDKPTGTLAKAAWVFPELGNIDPDVSQRARLEQLAALMTHPDNGRFTRTIVNRLWHRLMGRGIVHPTDAMDSEPWNADLLDFLAVDLADHGYDLKATLRVICNSEAYQGQMITRQLAAEPESNEYRGPVARRLTAEQFLDSVWQLTGAAPTTFDALVERSAENTVRTRRAERIRQRRRGVEGVESLPRNRVSDEAGAAGVQVSGEAPRNSEGGPGTPRMVRASLVKSDVLMRSLGRPNRDQIVTMRPTEFTTLEAIDLANEESLSQAISQGARRLKEQHGESLESLVTWIYRFALSRNPTEGELALAEATWGPRPSDADIEDLLWAIIMLPEFQWVR